MHVKNPIGMTVSDAIFFKKCIRRALKIPGEFLEIGTNAAYGSRFIRKHMGHDKRKLYTIDPSPQVDRDTLAEENIILFDAPSRDVIWTKPLAFLYIDGCHCFDCVINDIEFFTPYVSDGGIVVFHDTLLHYDDEREEKFQSCIYSKERRYAAVAAAIHATDFDACNEEIEQLDEAKTKFGIRAFIYATDPLHY